MKNESHSQSNTAFIDQFRSPVVVVDEKHNLVASNKCFQEDAFLSEKLHPLLRQIEGLQQSDHERFHWSVDEQHFVLTAIEMDNGHCLIKIAKAQSSELAKRYQNLLTAIDQMSDGLIICDAESRIDLVNLNMERFFPQIELMPYQGKPLLSFVEEVLLSLAEVNDTDPREVLSYVKNCIDQKRTFTFSFFNTEKRFLEYRDRVTYTGERIGLIIDETKLKSLNDQLTEAWHQANQLSEAKSNFMAAMSHEVRTPLNAIIGLLDLCSDEPPLAENELFQKIHSNAQQLLRLINDVLDFSKFDANRVSLSEVETDLRALCENCIEEFSGQAQKRNALMHLFVDPRLPKTVLADDLRLRQVIGNLLSNALKFTNRIQPVVELRVDYISADECCVSVADNGIGISKDNQSLIFTDFTQASPDIHRKFGGTGLGLSICQKICELMNSKLHVESEEGEGAKFFFNLSLNARSPSEIDLLQRSNTLISVRSNDRLFLKELADYQPFVNIDSQYSDELPDNLENSEFFFYLPDSQYTDSLLLEHRHPQLILLYRTSRYREYKTFAQLQRAPLKLRDFLAHIGLWRHKERASASSAQTEEKFEHVRALVVEDNNENMYVLRKQFAKLGVEASFAMSANDAEVFFEQQPFNLVITDYQMPGTLGSDLIRRLRLSETSRNLKPAKMLVLTADKTDKSLADCQNAGADDVILKPLTIEGLQSLLTSVDALQGAPEKEKSIDETSLASPSEARSPSSRAKTATTEESFFIDDGIHNDVEDRGMAIDLEILKDFIGDVDKQDRNTFLSQFLHNLLKMQSDLSTFAETKNWNNLQKIAHSLKSSALIVGAKELSLQCETLEASCAEDASAETLKAHWQRVDAAIRQVELAVTEVVSDE